jgi:hypothetical protein
VAAAESRVAALHNFNGVFRNTGYAAFKIQGIYVVKGDIIPIQIIETKLLSEDDNLWLKELRGGLNNDIFQKIIKIGNTKIEWRNYLWKKWMNFKKCLSAPVWLRS